MNRRLVPAVLCVGGAVLAATAAAQREPAAQGAGASPPSVAIQIEKIRDSLYMLRGGGGTVRVGDTNLPTAGNTLALITAKGVVLVDTKRPGWGKPIMDKLEEITDKPVTTIINTHAHFDHVGGNVEFAPMVEVVAHENTAKLMQEMRPVAGGPAQPNIFKDNGGRGLPTRTFKERLTLGTGAERIDLYYFGRAHTSGDTWVVFPELRVVHVGDVFPLKAVPVLDANNGGTGVEYAQTIAKAVATLTQVDTVITGHFSVALTIADLRTYGEFTRGFVQVVQAAKKAGRTVDDFVSTWRIPERFLKEGYVDITHLRPLRPDVELIWNETK